MPKTLTQLCVEVGIPDSVTNYLTEGLQFKSAEVLAEVGGDAKSFLDEVFVPRKEGCTIKDVSYSLKPG